MGFCLQTVRAGYHVGNSFFGGEWMAAGIVSAAMGEPLVGSGQRRAPVGKVAAEVLDKIA